MIRKIITIDAEKCNGCGLCVDACHEGAIVMQNGKAVLLRDDYCDGLGDCLPVCPTDAISFEEREALPYDEAAVEENIRRQKLQNMQVKSTSKECATTKNGKKSNKAMVASASGCPSNKAQTLAPLPCGCPGSNTYSFKPLADKPLIEQAKNHLSHKENVPSCLQQWPVQIALVPVNAPYFADAHLLVAADCTAFAYGNFHAEFMQNKITLIGCPKLDDASYVDKLTEIIKHNSIQSVCVARMSVPCCGGIEKAVESALKKSGKMLPWQVITINPEGQKIASKP